MIVDLTIKNTDIPRPLEWFDKLCSKHFDKNANSNTLQKEKQDKLALSDQQKCVLKALRDNKYNIIKGFRQCGISTLLYVNGIYSVLYGSASKLVYIYRNTCACEYAKRAFLSLLDSCDEYIYLTSKNNRKIEISYRNNNKSILFLSQNNIEEYFRGMNKKADEIYIDDAAFIRTVFVSYDLPRIIKEWGCNVTIASTPDKSNGMFYDIWDSTINGRGKFNAISLKWYLEPRFNKNLKGTGGLISYNITNLGMMFEALEHGDMITNDWYEERKALLSSSIINEVDGEFI